MTSLFTDATCGEACWYAREEICRCSCGGKNHGCLQTGDGSQPTRTCKIDGQRYELKGVGGNVAAEAIRLNKEAGIQFHFAHTARQHYGYTPAAVMRPPTKSQLNWTELASEKDRIKDLPAWDWWGRSIYLLWVRIK